MADSFMNPQDQASLEALKTRLTQLDADVRASLSQLTAESAAMRDQQRATRAEGAAGTRSTASAVPALQQEVQAINEQVISYERLNALISERIQLEARAATAARETALASGGRTAELAQVAPQWSSQRQRILDIAGAAPAAGLAAAGAPAASEYKALSVSQAEATATARELSVAEGGVRQELIAAAAAMAEYDTSLAATGALSGAALKGLANGTITLGQLGNQITQTIGKFGGWTLAATAVYGAIGSLAELKKGAVDTASAVQGLTKFLPDLNRGQARDQIVAQAQSTATPVKDVGDASQQFAKVFKNQTDVFTATHVALTAAKLDNISLADSYKYLTAIVQETGVGVGALPGIFDQITAAQDRLGARVSQILPAFAGSVGAVQTAKGDPNQLLGLEALTLVRTGRSGSQVATGYARGATNFFPTAASRGVLERFGIDPNQGFTQALIDAMMKAEKSNLPEANRRELSTAFFGPLRGSMFTNLFNTKPDQLQNFLQQTQPGASKGLAENQLGKTMGQANNQLALLKVNLQAIGAELTGSHFTSPFGVLLQILNRTLEASVDLLKVWDSLPGPIKTAASDMALAAAAIGLARRFNIGGAMAGSDNRVLQMVAPAFSRSPAKVRETQVGQYMTGLTGTINAELQAASVRQMRSAIRLAAAQEELAAITAAEGAESEAAIAARTRLTQADTALATSEAEIASLQKVGSAENLAAVRAQMMAGGAAGGIGGAGTAAAAGFAAGGVGAGGAAAAEFSTAEALDVMGLSTFGMAIGRVSAAMEFMAANAIPLAIAAFVAFDAAKQSIGDTQKNRSQTISGISAASTPQQAIDAYNKSLKGGSFRVPLIGLHLPNVPGSISDLLSGQDSANSDLLHGRLNELQAQQNALAHTEPLLRKVQADERAGNNKGAFDLFKGDTVMKTVRPDEYNKIFNDLYKKMEGQAATGGKKGASNPFAKFESASQDLTNQLEPMLEGIGNASKVFGTKSGDLNSLANGYAYIVEKFGKNTGDTKAMQAIVQAQSALVNAVDKNVTDLTNLAKMSTTDKGQQGYYEQALTVVNRSQSQIRSAASAAERLPGANVEKIKAAEQQALGLVAQKRQTAIEGLLALVKSETDVSVSSIGGVGPEADLKRAEAQLTGTQNQLSTAKRVGADAQLLNGLQSQLNQQLVTVLQDRVTYYQQLSQAETQFQQGGTADPVAQAQIAINQLGQLYIQLQNAGDHSQVQLLQILAQQRQAVLQQIAAQVSLNQAQSQASLSQMNIGQPQQVQLTNAVTIAQRELSFVQSLPANKVNPQTLISAYNSLYQAQGALAQFMIQQGEQLIQAESQLAQGSTFDPIQIAELALSGAQKLLAYDKAHNMPQATIVGEMAQVAQDYKALQEARWQKADQTTQFLAETYQITGAQEIVRLKGLLTAMKKAHASYSDIQRVSKEIYDLEFNSTGSLNLNVGSMHLPSTYEVRSAILGGRAAQKRQTASGLLAEVKTQVYMSVVVNKDADMKKFTKAMNDALGTSVDGLAQAAGLI